MEEYLGGGGDGLYTQYNYTPPEPGNEAFLVFTHVQCTCMYADKLLRNNNKSERI